MSLPAVHPLGIEPVVGQQPQGVRMNDVPGKPGTVVGLGVRSAQFVFAVITLSVMASTDFTEVAAFSSLVVAASLLCLWSFVMIILDVYALSVRRRLRHRRFDVFFTVGDAFTGVLLFVAACASSGTTFFISNVLMLCASRHCGSYTTSPVFAFFGAFATFFSFFLNLSSWASRSRAA